LTVDDLPAWIPQSERKAVLDRLQNMELAAQPDGFQFSVTSSRVELGWGLMRELAKLPKAQQARLVQLIYMHEVFHLFQGVMTENNYVGIGRHAVGLENIDYSADAFALTTLAAADLRQMGTAGTDP